MKRLSRWVWTSMLVLFVGTMPHAVGATLPVENKVKDDFCLIILPSMQHMKAIAKAEGKKQALEEWHSYKEWQALYKLWMQESKWDYTADNKHSTAYGIPQILDMPTDTNMIEQIQLGIKYIKTRYGSPTKALAFHNMRGWY
jgi:hypothetical protein